MTVAELQRFLEGRQSAGRLRLDADLPGVSGWKALLAALDTSTVELGEVSLVSADGAIDIQGTTTVLGLPSVGVHLHFAADRAGIGTTLDVGFERGVELAVPGATSFAVTDVGIELQQPGSGSPLTGQLRGTLAAGSLRLPLALTLPAGRDGWTLRGAFDKVPIGALEAAADLFGGVPQGWDLPAPLGALAQALVISGLELRGSAAVGSIDSISLTITSDRDWPLIPGHLALGHPALTLTLFAPGAERMLAITASGFVEVDGSVVPVAVARAASGRWSVRLPATYLPLPGPAGLLRLLGETTGAALPAGFAASGGIGLTFLELGFETDPPRIVSAAVSFATAAAWRFPGLAQVALDGASIEITADDDGVAASLAGTLAIGDLRFLLRGEKPAEAAAWGDLHGALAQRVDLAELVRHYFEPLPFALPQTVLESGAITLSSERGIAIEAKTAIDLLGLAEAIGIPLPVGFASVALDRIAIEVNPATGRASLSIATETRIAFPGTGGNRIEVSAIAVRIGREPDTGVTLGCRFVLRGDLTLSDELALTVNGLSCTWQSGGDWGLTGEIAATLFERRLELVADIARSGDTHRLMLRHDASFTLLSWNDLVVEASALVLAVGQAPAGQGYDWTLAGATRFEVAPLFAAAGTLSLDTGPQGAAVTASSEPPTLAPIVLPVPIPTPPSIELAIGALYLRAGGKGAGGPRIEASATMTLRDIPAPVERCFPSGPMRGSLRVDAQRFDLAFDPPPGFGIELPALRLDFAGGTSLDLGQPTLAVERFLLELRGKRTLGAQLRLGIPGRLNYLFGADADGQPSMDLFATQVDLRLALGEAIAVQMLSSPLKPLRYYDKYGGVWADWNFGELGTLSFEVPEFAFEGGRWSAKGGFERLTEVKLPLRPLQWALAQGGLPGALLAAMPDAIPLVELDLRRPDFYAQVERLLGAMSQPAKDAFHQVAELLRDGIERLPERLAEYLSFKLPRSGLLTISMTPGGGFSFDFHTAAGETIKLLLPALLGPMPALLGISLRGVSFGLAHGGALAVLKVDGHLDVHDLLGLVFALTTGKGRALSNRIILERVTALAPTGVPIAIPLFYDQIGWEYRDLLGLQLQTHWAFPEPELTPTDYFQLFGGLLRFLTRPEVLLHRDGVPEAMALNFTVGPNFVALPDYLGAGSLGITDGLPALPVADSFARLLDGLKTANPTHLIQAIPLRYQGRWLRIGSRQVRFGPLSLEAAWCITTEAEYRNQILPDAEAMAILAHAGGEEILSTLPADARKAALDRGFIVLLMAGAGLEPVLSGRTQFGIALTPAGGCETGFQWQVSVANLLQLRLGGSLQADQHGVAVAGQCALLFDGHNLVRTSGALEVKDTHFLVGLGLDIVNLHLQGQLTITAREMRIEGRVDWPYGPHEGVSGVAAFARIGAGGLVVGFSAVVFGNGCEVGVLVGGEARRPRARLAFAITSALQRGLNDSLADIGAEVGQEVDRLSQDIASKVDETDKLVINLGGVRDTVVERLEGTAKALPGIVAAKVKQYIDAFVNGIPKSWGRRAAAAALAVPIKRVVGATVQRELAPHITGMRRLAAALKAASPREAQAILRRALQDTLSQFRRFTYTYRVKLGPFGTISYPYTYVMPPELVQLVEAGIKGVDSLSEHQQMVVNAQQLRAVEERRRQVIDGIARDVQAQVTRAIPQLQHIAMETELGTLAPTQWVSVGILYQGSPREYRVEADVRDLVGCAKAAARMLVAALAKT